MKEIIDIYKNPLHAEIFRGGHQAAIKNIHEPIVAKLEVQIKTLEFQIEMFKRILKDAGLDDEEI